MEVQREVDETYMELAITLAEQGRGKVNPNPLVGAVIVKDGKVIGTGYHKAFGQAHGEINAIKDAKSKGTVLEGATLYVTLEPCSHYGKTPPCTKAIIKNKMTRVVIGIMDPNPLVAGNGAKQLEDAGIQITKGILEEECKKQNEVFLKYITEKKPFVTMKFAMSLDGKIATNSGDSKWISGEESRKQVHKTRSEMMGIMVGIGTILKDDPLLTCRLKQDRENGAAHRNPIRIIADSKLAIPLSAKVLEDLNKESNLKTIIATTQKAIQANLEKEKKLKEVGATLLWVREKDNRVDLQDLMDKLAKLEIDSILLEGGGTLNFSALEQGIVDKVTIYIAPKIIGGENAKTPVEGSGFAAIKDAISFEHLTYHQVGEDVLVQGYLKKI